MAKITINEIDRSMYSRPIENTEDVVFVPVNTSWGPFEPTLVTSVAEFRALYGVDPEAGSNEITSYEYALNVLASGMAILAQRIEEQNEEKTEQIESGIVLVESPTVEGQAEWFKFRTGFKAPDDALGEYAWATVGSLGGKPFVNAIHPGKHGDNVQIKLVTRFYSYTDAKKEETGWEGCQKLYLETRVNGTTKETLWFADIYARYNSTDGTWTHDLAYASNFDSEYVTFNNSISITFIASIKKNKDEPVNPTLVTWAGTKVGSEVTFSPGEGQTYDTIPTNRKPKIYGKKTAQEDWTELSNWSEAEGSTPKSFKITLDASLVDYTIFNLEFNSTNFGVNGLNTEGKTSHSISLKMEPDYVADATIVCKKFNEKASVPGPEDIGDGFKISRKYENETLTITVEAEAGHTLDFDISEVVVTYVPEKGEISTISTYRTLVGGKDLTREGARSAVALSIFGAESKLTDKWNYDIKIISNGGYCYKADAFDMAQAMSTIAITRKDCLALIDYPAAYKKESTEQEEHIDSIKKVQDWVRQANVKNSYCTIYAPWCYTTVSFSDTTYKWVPASLVALRTIAQNIANNGSICDAPAGIRRGTVSIVRPQFDITGTDMEEMQSGDSEKWGNCCCNPIMKVKNYGYCIFGQRTLMASTPGETSALQEVGCRLTINEVKRAIREVAVSLIFEHNTLKTWASFTSLLGGRLNNFVQNGFLTDYEMIRDESTSVDPNTIKAIVRIAVTRAVEYFDIDLEIYSGDVTFTEEE